MLTRNLTLPLTVVAVIFHAVGFAGIALYPVDMVRNATPLHLVLMAILLIISFLLGRKPATAQKMVHSPSRQINYLYWFFFIALLGFIAEWIGVHTGWLFGDYNYTETLGARVQEIPLLIGINWAVVVTGAVCIAARLFQKKIIIPIAAAVIATAYDWLMEPVAMRLNYWQWADGIIPVYNYICWAALSFVMALLWHTIKLHGNQFAINLLLIQAVFFLLLRLFYL